jgi:unspecific monooxygenase
MRTAAFPPGPREPALVQTLTYVRDPVTALERWGARYGDLFTIKLVGFGRFVFAAAPADLRRIFTADPEEVKTGVTNGQLRPIVGPQSILLLDGQPHHRHRRMMLPPFHGERLVTYAEEIHAITRRTVARWPRGEAFALHPHMLRITLEVLMRTVFGLREERRIAELSALFSTLIDGWSSPLLPMLAFYGVDALALAPWLPAARRKQRVDREVRAEIAARIAAPADDARDVFGLLLAARDEAGAPLSADELRDELVTLMMAGHETSATALAWAFERLLAHPHVLARVQAELATVTKDGALDVAAVGELPYLDAVVRETLRQRPIFAFIARKTTVPFELGGYQLPPGTFLCPAIQLAHRRAETYPEPETFEPERFVGKKVDPYAWLPFGGGGRRCLGLAFAFLEIKLILATVLTSTELRLEAGGPLPRVLRGVTVAPAGGTRVVMR